MLKCNVKEISYAINKLTKVIKKRTVEVLNGILFETKNGKISMTATNKEITETIDIDCVYDNEMAFVIKEPRIVSSLLSKTTSDEGTIELIENSVLIKSGKTKANFEITPANQFPRTQEVESIVKTNMKSSKLLECLSYIDDATNDEDIIVNTVKGVNLKTSNGKFVFTTCDGHRLTTATAENSISGEINTTIPRSAVAVLKTLPYCENDVEMLVGENIVEFVTENHRIVIKCFDFAYYDRVDALTTNDYISKIVVNKKDFIDKIGRCKTLTNKSKEEEKQPLVLEIGDNSTISFENGRGKYSEDIEEISFEGSPLRMGFNMTYFIQLLNKVECDDVELFFTGKTTPVYIKNNELFSMILPVALRN